ncbi:MAG TPA: hypothetical protein VIK91_22350 [Nannocystis sp.]
MTAPTFDPQQLHAYHDGELTPEERVAVERILAQDPRASAYLAGLKSLHSAIVAGLEAEAARVPEARFEQVWDEIERALDDEQRQAKAPPALPSLWERLREVLRPLFVPAASVGAVAAVALAVWFGRGAGEAPTNTDNVVASNPAAVQPVLPDISTPPVDEPEIVLPAPNGGPAHIQRIEWGVKSGRISEIEGKRATTTVIWISDDDDETGSERSL